MNNKHFRVEFPYIVVADVFEAITPELVNRTFDLILSRSKETNALSVTINPELHVALSAILLKGLAMADGRVDACEIQNFGHMLLDLLIGKKLNRMKILTTIKNINSRKVAYWMGVMHNNRQHAKSLLRDMIKLAFADSDFSESERRLILNIGERLGFKLPEIRRINHTFEENFYEKIPLECSFPDISRSFYTV